MTKHSVSPKRRKEHYENLGNVKFFTSVNVIAAVKNFSYATNKSRGHPFMELVDAHSCIKVHVELPSESLKRLFKALKICVIVEIIDLKVSGKLNTGKIDSEASINLFDHKTRSLIKWKPEQRKSPNIKDITHNNIIKLQKWINHNHMVFLTDSENKSNKSEKMSDDESSSSDESYVVSSKSPKKRTSTRSSEKKRKYEKLVMPTLSRTRLDLSSSTDKKNDSVLDIFFPNHLLSIVRKDSLKRASTVLENQDYLTLEEIHKPDKFNLYFELLKMELYPDKDLAILRIRDGTICPSSVLCFPNSSNWESLERSIIEDPVCRSKEPVVDLVLYNSSFSILTFKEFVCYRVKNVMAVKAKTIDNKTLILCANGKDAYTTRLLCSNEVSKQILRKTTEKQYQELEEKYLQLLSIPQMPKHQTSNSCTVMPKKYNNIKEDEITNKISVRGKTRKSNVEDSDEEKEEDRIEKKRTKLKVGKVQSDIKNRYKEAIKLHTTKKTNEIANKIIIPKTSKEETSLKEQSFDEFRKRSPRNLKEIKKDSKLKIEKYNTFYQTKKNYENARSKLIMAPKTKEERLSSRKQKNDDDDKRLSGNVIKFKKMFELETEEDSNEEEKDSNIETSKLHKNEKTNEIVSSKKTPRLMRKAERHSFLKLKRGNKKIICDNVKKSNKNVELEMEEDSDEEEECSDEEVEEKEYSDVEEEEEYSEEEEEEEGSDKMLYEIKKVHEISKDKKTMMSETNDESLLLRKLKNNENDNKTCKSVSKNIKKLSKKFSSETEEEVRIEEVNKTKITDEIEKDKVVLISKINLKTRIEGFNGDGDPAKSSKSKGEIENNKYNATGTKKPNLLATTKAESKKTSIIQKLNQYEDNSSKEGKNLNTPKEIRYSCKKVTTMRSKVNVDDLATYKTISELNIEHECVNTFGIIINILKENNKIYKWRIAVEIIDQTQEKSPLKIYLFLPQRALTSLINVIKLHQIIELVGLKVAKYNRAITGRVFAANQIELYDSITGKDIEWRGSSSKLNESESTLEIITNLRSWFKDKHIQSEENVTEDQNQELSSNTSQFAESDPGDDEHIQNRVSYPRKKNSDEAKDNQLQLKTKQTSIDKISSPLLNKKKSCLYNMLDQIVSKENIDEVRLLKISILKFFELKDLTEDDKFNMIIEVVNIHRYDEVNLDVIQVSDGTRCPLPMLHVPLEKSWSIAKNKILCNHFYASDSPTVDILCFESQPHLITLQVGKRYKIYNCLVIKTQLSDASNEMDRYVICAEGKDCELRYKSKIKRSNKDEIKAVEPSFLPSVFQESKDYSESLRPLKHDQSEKEKATNSHIEKKQTRVQDLDSTTHSLIDLDETDGIHADIPSGIATEIESMMREESALGLPITLSEDIHLKNSGSDPTYSQFAKHANERSKLFKTSTQTSAREAMVCTLSSINSNNAQHLECTDLLNVSPKVLNENNIVYSSDSMASLRLELDDEDDISSKGMTENNDNVDEVSDAGSESILSHRYLNKCLIDLDLTDQNVMIVNEKKILLEKEKKTSSSSELEIVELEENITPKKKEGSLSISKHSSATKASPMINKFLKNPLKAQSRLLIQSVLEENFKLPSRCFFKSSNHAEDSSEDSLESEDEDMPEDSSVYTVDSRNYITTVTDFPDLPIIPIKTFLEIQNTNCHRYTTIPLKLSPELKDGWEEKAVHCICSKCNQTYVLSDVNKIVSEGSDNWPNQKIPICPLDECPLTSASARFHFEMEIKLVKFNVTCTALLVSESAETFLDCSVMEFLNCAEKRKEVKSRLKHLFHQNKTENTNIYSFILARKNMFDVTSGPLYIKDIQLK